MKMDFSPGQTVLVKAERGCHEEIDREVWITRIEHDSVVTSDGLRWTHTGQQLGSHGADRWEMLVSATKENKALQLQAAEAKRQRNSEERRYREQQAIASRPAVKPKVELAPMPASMVRQLEGLTPEERMAKHRLYSQQKSAAR